MGGPHYGGTAAQDTRKAFGRALTERELIMRTIGSERAPTGFLDRVGLLRVIPPRAARGRAGPGAGGGCGRWHRLNRPVFIVARGPASGSTPGFSKQLASSEATP